MLQQKTPVPTPIRPAFTAGLAFGLLVAGAPASADMAAINYNLDFQATGLNPWDAGPAFSNTLRFDLLHHQWQDVRLPNLHGDPVSALADFIGIKGLFNMTLGASTSGDIGISAGYHVDGGTLSLAYPGVATLTVPDTYAFGQSFSIGSSFVPEPLRQFFGGYASTPHFNTTTPVADAYAALHLNVSAGVTAAAEACVPLIGCFGHSRSVDLSGFDKTQTLVSVSSQTGISVLDQPIFGFDQPHNVGGWLTVTPRSPDIGMRGVLAGDGNLVGHVNSSVIDFSVPVSRLIPVIGPLLQNNISFPPLGYELASFSSQARIGVFQDLTIDPDITVELLFSAPMVQVRADGSKKVIGTGTPVSFRAGETLNLLPTFDAGRESTLTVKPAFLGDAMVTNRTGLRFSGDLQVEGLKLDTPLGSVGPAIGPVTVPVAAAEIPFWEPPAFHVDLPDFSLPTFRIQNDGGDPLLQQITKDVSYIPVTPPDADGLAKYRFTVDIPGLSPATKEVIGYEMESILPGCQGTVGALDVVIDDTLDLCRPERYFVTDDDLVFNLIDSTATTLRAIERPISLGSVFCIVCNDATSLLDSLLASDSIGTGIDQIYLSDLSAFPSSDHRDPNDPWLTDNLPPSRLTVTPLRIGPTITVPEPCSANLLALGFPVLVRAAGDRRLARPAKRVKRGGRPEVAAGREPN